MAVEVRPKSKGVLTVVVQGTGADLNHAASREAEKMRDNGMLITRTSDVYFDKGGNPALDMEWKIDPNWDAPEHPARTFQGHIARISTEHPEGSGKELVNDQPQPEVDEIKRSSSREAGSSAGKKGGQRMKSSGTKKSVLTKARTRKN